MAVANKVYIPVMEDKLFYQWAALLEEKTGMHMPVARKSFLETNLGLRMREIGCEEYDEYYQYLKDIRYGETEWIILIDRLTIHETRFFRHPPSIDFIQQIFLPAFSQGNTNNAQLKIWSAGCSTGEEAYTLAMLVDNYLRQQGLNYDYKITATDISIPALNIAKEAIYNTYKIQSVSEHFKLKYFESVENGRYQVIKALRKRICFAAFNIVAMEKSPLAMMDLIVCQNLLIYFTQERKLQIIENLVNKLTPGGTLMLGAGEILSIPHQKLERISYPNTLIFRKIE